MYPEDPVERVKVDQWLFYGSSTFTTLAQQYGLFTHRFPEDVPPAKKHYESVLRDMFDMFDRHLADSEFLAGDNYTVADPYLFTVAQWMEADGVDPGRFPKIAAHRDMMRNRSTVQDALRAELERP